MLPWVLQWLEVDLPWDFPWLTKGIRHGHAHSYNFSYSHDSPFIVAIILPHLLVPRDSLKKIPMAKWHCHENLKFVPQILLQHKCQFVVVPIFEMQAKRVMLFCSLVNCAIQLGLFIGFSIRLGPANFDLPGQVGLDL